MELFHGSNTIVQVPKILTNGFYKDFGYGFYCTGIERQARRWALTKRTGHVVNVYEYEETSKLSIKTFSRMSEEWLQFIVDFRWVSCL